MGHGTVLQQLQPGLRIGGVYESDFDIEAACLDRLQSDLDSLALEMFPDTAVDTISDWENRFGITPGSGDTLAIRRAALVAKLRSRRCRRKPDFFSVAQGLGFNQYVDGATPAPWVQIVDGQFLPFLCGRSIVGRDILYDGLAAHRLTTVTVTGTHVSGGTGNATEIARALCLQAFFEAARTRGTSIVYVDG
jgi:hypothetical protein